MLWIDDKLCEKEKGQQYAKKMLCWRYSSREWCDWSENNFSRVKVQNREKLRK